MATRIELEKPKMAIRARYFQSLGKGLYLFDSVFNGITYIHVREVLNDEIPTKNGISLTMGRCNELFSGLPQLDIAVNETELKQDAYYRRHLGGNWYVSVNSVYRRVSIRKFWLPEGATDVCATRKGVSLTFDQYRELKNGLRTIPSFVPELYGVIPCYSEPGHDMYNCSECSPNENYVENIGV